MTELLHYDQQCRDALIDGNVAPIDDLPDDERPEFIGPWNNDNLGFDEKLYEAEMARENHDTALANLREIAEQAGPSVELGKRATYLLECLNAYSSRGRIEGMLASRSKELIARHGGEQNLEDISRWYGTEGRRALAVASGYDEMQAAGMTTEDDTYSLTREVRSFKEKYYEKPNSKAARERFRKSLVAQKERADAGYETIPLGTHIDNIAINKKSHKK